MTEQQNFKCTKETKKLLKENMALTNPPTNIKNYMAWIIKEHNKNLKGGDNK